MAGQAFAMIEGMDRWVDEIVAGVGCSLELQAEQKHEADKATHQRVKEKSVSYESESYESMSLKVMSLKALQLLLPYALSYLDICLTALQFYQMHRAKMIHMRHVRLNCQEFVT